MRGKAKDMLREYAENIIREVMQGRNLSEYEYRKSHCPNHVKARTAVIKRLHADGFTRAMIVEFTGFGLSAVERRVCIDAAARDDARRKAAYHAKKLAGLIPSRAKRPVEARA